LPVFAVSASALNLFAQSSPRFMILGVGRIVRTALQGTSFQPRTARVPFLSLLSRFGFLHWLVKVQAIALAGFLLQFNSTHVLYCFSLTFSSSFKNQPGYFRRIF
jgi:hypothetical protein